MPRHAAARTLFASIGAVATLLITTSADSAELNGFDLTAALVPINEIQRGGPPRDGIPSIDRPKFVSVRDAGFLNPDSSILGVARYGIARAYPFTELARAPSPFDDTIGGQRVRIEFDDAHRTGRVRDTAGRELASVTAFWFAWYAFHPDTEVFVAAPAPAPG
jgi:hypothetical protein